jgi:hypothetical protein
MKTTAPTYSHYRPRSKIHNLNLDCVVRNNSWNSGGSGGGGGSASGTFSLKDFSIALYNYGQQSAIDADKSIYGTLCFLSVTQVSQQERKDRVTERSFVTKETLSKQDLKRFKPVTKYLLHVPP